VAPRRQIFAVEAILKEVRAPLKCVGDAVTGRLKPAGAALV
jgi:hypothetical protein